MTLSGIGPSNAATRTRKATLMGKSPHTMNPCDRISHISLLFDIAHSKWKYVEYILLECLNDIIIDMIPVK